MLILRCGENFALCKRPGRGLLADLWQFPDCLGALTSEQVLNAVRTMGMEPTNILRQSERSHVFTHVQWNMRGYYLEVRNQAPEFLWVNADQIDRNYALPTAYRQFWDSKDI